MIVELDKCRSVTFRLRTFTLTVEPVEWASGKSAVHLHIEGEARLFAETCRPANEHFHKGHLILTGPNP